MKVPNVYGGRRAGVTLEMTPMIDMVFLLIIFFVWTSGFDVAEKLLPTRLSPNSSKTGQGVTLEPTPEQDFDPVIVRIRRVEGQSVWEVNGAPVGSLQELESQFRELAGLISSAPVSIIPSGDVPIGDAIDVYDAARASGFTKIQFPQNLKL